MELLSLLDWEAEDAYRFQLMKVDFTTENPVITIAIAVGFSDPLTQEWEIVIDGYVRGGFTQRYFETLFCKDDHPLLWEYSMEHASLYFSGTAADVSALTIDLLRVHEEQTGGWSRFNHFSGVLNSPAGLLSSGPVPLLEAYTASLERHGIHWSIIGNHKPHLHGEVKEVLFLGSDYIIARHFDFRRLS
ncbi:hypothetical protein ACTJJB_05655 [Chitinophaga sp. 22536]|uniref:hypothetical protein n=1 Tax=unclassified Chitinophaga TaxID=2619133 RepID=UPI003F85F764